MHYYQFNIADYRKDTQHLSPMEHYIYRELMDWYYLDETPIPLETQWVSRRLRLVSENNPDLENVLFEFFEKTENGWVHGRIEEEIGAYRRKAETAKANGRKGGRPKKPRKTQPVKNRNPEKTESKANHKPITNNQYKDICDRVIDYLNEKAGKRSRHTDTNRTLITARLVDGFTEDDCRKVIDNRVARWKGTSQDEYLRPDTLFRPSKFEGYLNDNGGTDANLRSGRNPGAPEQKLTPAERVRARRAERRNATG